MAAPSSKQMKSHHWLEIKAKHLPTLSLNCSISHFHKKKHTSSFRKPNLKILRGWSLTRTHYCFGSYLGFSGDTPIDLNRECLQAYKHIGERLRSERKHSIALRVLALLNTPQVNTLSSRLNMDYSCTSKYFLTNQIEKTTTKNH